MQGGLVSIFNIHLRSCTNPKLVNPDHHAIISMQGEVAERPKAHAWRACDRHKRSVGSNPTLSAR